jgi:peptidoglycan/xylan/chitin deacetylase (PgdA/CDA1 family)
VILTHDIDSKEGLFNAIKKFLPIEESIGSRSVNYVVPFGWSLDRGMLDELVARGHELGIHGFDHANRTAFADLHELRKRIDAVRSLVECYGVRGYRAPSLLRTPELYFELKRLYRYDSSIPTSGGPFPCPNNGCASARPFDIGGISVLPISLPRDGSLRFLGYNPDDILKIWRDCAVRIARSGGVVVLLTHCEYRFSGNKKMFNIYRHFLEWISEEPAFRFATTDEIFNTMPLHKT